MDADDAEARIYIESTYGIASGAKYEDAMRAYLREKSYNPVQEMLNSLVWDGESRV